MGRDHTTDTDNGSSYGDPHGSFSIRGETEVRRQEAERNREPKKGICERILDAFSPKD